MGYAAHEPTQPEFAVHRCGNRRRRWFFLLGQVPYNSLVMGLYDLQDHNRGVLRGSQGHEGIIDWVSFINDSGAYLRVHEIANDPEGAPW